MDITSIERDRKRHADVSNEETKCKRCDNLTEFKQEGLGEISETKCMTSAGVKWKTMRLAIETLQKRQRSESNYYCTEITQMIFNLKSDADEIFTENLHVVLLSKPSSLRSETEEFTSIELTEIISNLKLLPTSELREAILKKIARFIAEPRQYETFKLYVADVILHLSSVCASWRKLMQNSRFRSSVKELLKFYVQQISSPELRYVDVEIHEEMRGLTVVDNRLFVLPSNDPVINVYYLHSIRPQSVIHVPDLSSPHGLAGCTHNKVLYISDARCIRRVTTFGELLSPWQMKENYISMGLSMTSEHNLLVSAYIFNFTLPIERGTSDQFNASSIVEGTNESRNNRTGFTVSDTSVILEYNSEGDLLREIQLDSSFDWLWMAAELSPGKYLICHGVGSTLHRLCIVDSEGQISKCFGGMRGNGESQLNSPCSISICFNRELVFVADHYNQRVLKFTTKLAYIGLVETARKLSQPRCVHYDPKTDQLFVDASTRRVESQRGEVRGLTVVDNKLFVVYQAHQLKIDVFDTYRLKGLPDIAVPDMKDPQDLTGCSHNKLLYISDQKYQIIHKVNINGGTASHWKVNENHLPCGISMTSEHNLLVTVQIADDPRTIRCSGLVEYTTEAQVVHVIEFDSNIAEAWQTIELSVDQYITCHYKHLSIVNREGKIVNTITETEGQLNGHLKVPRSLAIDRKTEIVFLPDQYNHCVDVFSFGLAYLGTVHTSRALVNPLRVCFDSEMDRLLVGERSGSMSGRVTTICPVKVLGPEKQ